MTINPFHDNEWIAPQKAKDHILRACGDILGDMAVMISDSRETLDAVYNDIKTNSPRWQEFIQSHISVIRIRAFGSEIYEPKTGLEVRTLYRETVRYCLDKLNKQEAGGMRMRAEAREKEKG